MILSSNKTNKQPQYNGNLIPIGNNMKRKHFTKPPHLTSFGNWLFAELFTRNITINEMAAKLGVQATTLRSYMTQPPTYKQTNIPGHRILHICAILSPTVMDYHKMVPNAMRALPNYYTIYNTQKEAENNAKH